MTVDSLPLLVGVRRLAWITCATLAVATHAWDGVQQGLPLSVRHATAEYRLRGAVWAFAESERGELILGADAPIVIGGERWQKVEVSDGYAFRALARGTNGRVWAGAIGDLGWLEADELGQWHFRSLKPALRESGGGAPDEIWEVQPTADGAVFVGEHSVYRWNGRRFLTFPMPAEPRLQPLRPTPEALWIYQPGVGVLRLDGPGPELLVAESELPPGPVLWALAPPAAAIASLAEGALVGTGEGVFIRRDANWVQLEEISKALAGALPVGAVRLGPDTFAVGTFLRGVIVASPAGQVKWRIDATHGLADNQVHALRADAVHGLWLGLSDGWAHVADPAAVSVFDPRNGLPADGLVGAATTGGDMYAATARNISHLISRSGPAQPASFAPLPSIAAPIWTIAANEKALFAGGFGGVWRWTGTAWNQERFTQADVFCLAISRQRPGLLYFTEGYAVKALLAGPRGWVTRDLGVDLGDTPVSLLEDEAGDLWVSTVLGGITHLRFQVGPGSAPERVTRYSGASGLPARLRRPQLALVGGRVFAFADNGVVVFNGVRAGFALEPVAREWSILAASEQDRQHGGWWLAERKGLSAMGVPLLLRAELEADGALRLTPTATPSLRVAGRVTGLRLAGGEQGPVLWVAGTGGLLRVAPGRPIPSAPPAIWLRQANVDAQAQPVMRPASGPFPSATKTLRFEFSAGAADFAAAAPVAAYQTRLAEIESDWSPAQPETWREFTGLAPGHYTFSVRTLDAAGRTSVPAVYAFGIAAPWWQCWPAITAAVLALAATVAGLVWLRLRALHRATERLNRLVEARTRELSLANAAKSEFLANVSHEIRNPLNGMAGLIAMLRHAHLGAAERELAESLSACARSLNRVFDEVLSFSSLEYGSVPVRVRSFELGALLREVVGVFHAQAEQRGCVLTLSLPSSGPLWLEGDDEKIRTIASNFAANALKYAPHGPVTIAAEFEAVPHLPAALDLTLEVRDRGPGVPPEEQELIFRKFVRGRQAHDQREPGAGLGLATCRMLAELLGGRVGVESEAGKGSTFYLQLRVARASAPAGVVEPQPVRATPGLSRGHALIVDDQDYNRRVLARIAERLGYAPRAVADAAAAMAAFASEQADVVFVDWELAGTKGSKVAQQLRALPGGHNCLIVATTAHDAAEIRHACFAAGMDGFALKPYDEASIAHVIDEVQTRRTPTTPDQLNLGIFSYVSYDDPATSRAAAEEYLATLDREMATLEAALTAGELAAVEATAHRIRSHASLVRCRPLNDAGRAMQTRARAAVPAERELLRAEMARHAAELRRCVEGWLGAHAPAVAEADAGWTLQLPTRMRVKPFSIA